MKKLFIFLMGIIFSLSPSFAQSSDLTKFEDLVFASEEPQMTNAEEIGKEISKLYKARKIKTKGFVLVRLIIDESGTYLQHEIISGQGPKPPTDLVELVEPFVPQITWTGAKDLDGKPISFPINLPFTFEKKGRVHIGLRVAIKGNKIHIK